MSCNNCKSHHNQPKGCKNNGYCSSDGCNKLSVFDWLSDISLPSGQEKFDCVEVRFKNSRKEFFRNSEGLPLHMGDVVATETALGYDVGVVTLTGELVKVQMKRKKVENTETLPKIYRKATQSDIDTWQQFRSKEELTQKRSRELAISLGLKMKISDVEYQGDGTKAIFYYTAEERVDFRQLIKDLAKAFGVRIEMKQIGFRQEAARLGGIGSCGRELCCSTWLSDFRSVTTTAARYQQLSLNPQKLAGQCGKLKCCLNYELDSYLDALKVFPKTDVRLITEKGRAVCQKIDIFRGWMWYTYEEDPMNWFKLDVTQVNEIISRNQNQITVTDLEQFSISDVSSIKDEFKNVVGQDSLTRFDAPKQKKIKGKNQRKPSNDTQQAKDANKKQRKPQANKNRNASKKAKDKKTNT